MYRYLFVLCILFAVSSFAHPMPGSVVNLSVEEHSINGEAKMPLLELENALGMTADNSLDVNTPFFASYFYNHIQANTDGNRWKTTIRKIETTSDIDSNIGNYHEVIVAFSLTPPDDVSLRRFAFDYDVIIHQVVTHKILVFITDDWRNGLHHDANAQPVGIIKTDFKNGKQRQPLLINLAEGSVWKGFAKMIDLGMEHIREGTDHLLFLLTLLLPAMLLVNGKRWANYGGMRYSLRRLASIITAFTIGHSITLLIGSFDWFRLPSQPVEIGIAISILVSAVHAIRPLFPGKEMYVAAGFGLIHGLAFASVLSDMNLSTTSLVFSIVGFNLGIELMQLCIVAVVVPWLLLLSQTKFYHWFRLLGASATAVCAIAWIAERSSGSSNVITAAIEKLQPYAPFCLGALAVSSVTMYVVSKRSDKKLDHFKSKPRLAIKMPQVRSLH